MVDLLPPSVWVVFSTPSHTPFSTTAGSCTNFDLVRSFRRQCRVSGWSPLSRGRVLGLDLPNTGTSDTPRSWVLSYPWGWGYLCGKLTRDVTAGVRTILWGGNIGRKEKRTISLFFGGSGDLVTLLQNSGPGWHGSKDKYSRVAVNSLNDLFFFFFFFRSLCMVSIIATTFFQNGQTTVKL